MLSKEALVKIHKKSAISDDKYLALLKDIQEETGALLMEGNLKKEIRDSINSFESYYEVEPIEIEDKNGNKMVTSLAWCSKLKKLIEHIVEKNNIKVPRVVIGGDSGQHKFIFTLSIFDLSDLSRDFWGYSRAGRRRTLVIAASDEMEESHPNISMVAEKLKLSELEDIDWILTGDQKFANLVFGVQCHACSHNCVYCEGVKMDENGNKTNSVDNGFWVPGPYRTIAINRGRRTLWKRLCGHLKGARSHLSTFKNVDFPNIPLPQSWEHEKIIFLLPPDPLHVIYIGPVQDVFTALKKLYPDLMTAFYRRHGIGRRRSQVAGNFTGPELKLLLREQSLADLTQIIANGQQISQYLRSLRELHKMVIKKEFTENHQDFIDDFAEKFQVVRELKLVSFTTKCHIILHHIGYYMRETGQSLYTADTSPTESTHSGFKNNQVVHNLLSMHQLGSPGQQLRLKRSMMRYNWKNLSFDLREKEPKLEAPDLEEPHSLTLEPQEELDLESYILQEEADAADEAGEAEMAVVEETETIETVKQVLHNESFHSILKLNTGKQRADFGQQPAEGGDGGTEGADEANDADPGTGLEGPAKPLVTKILMLFDNQSSMKSKND